MRMTSKLRGIALAVLALGTFQLRSAAAAPRWADACDDEAIAVLIYACDYLTGGDWSYGHITYWCDDSGHLSSGFGECYAT